MIYLIFVQYIKHRLQIMQECCEYDLMTNSVKFMQPMTSTLSEGDSSVCNLYLQWCSYLTNDPKVKTSVKTSTLDTNTSLQISIPFVGVSLFNDSLLQPMLHICNPLLQFADIKDPLLSTAALFSRLYSHRIQI